MVAAHAIPWPGEMAVFRSAVDGWLCPADHLRQPRADRHAGVGLLCRARSRASISAMRWWSICSPARWKASPTSTLFGGANALAVETAPGIWEIVQAGAAELIAPGRYRLTRLLRGQRGTEGAMGNPAPAGARVVVLDTAVGAAADRRGRSRSAMELAHRPGGAGGQRRQLRRAGLHASRSRPRALRAGPCRAAVAHGAQPGRSDDPLDAAIPRAGRRYLGTGRGAAGRGPGKLRRPDPRRGSRQAHADQQHDLRPLHRRPADRRLGRAARPRPDTGHPHLPALEPPRSRRSRRSVTLQF